MFFHKKGGLNVYS